MQDQNRSRDIRFIMSQWKAPFRLEHLNDDSSEQPVEDHQHLVDQSSDASNHVPDGRTSAGEISSTVTRYASTRASEQRQSLPRSTQRRLEPLAPRQDATIALQPVDAFTAFIRAAFPVDNNACYSVCVSGKVLSISKMKEVKNAKVRNLILAVPFEQQTVHMEIGLWHPNSILCAFDESFERLKAATTEEERRKVSLLAKRVTLVDLYLKFMGQWRLMACSNSFGKTQMFMDDQAKTGGGIKISRIEREKREREPYIEA